MRVVALASPDKIEAGTMLSFRIGGEVDPTVGFSPTITPLATYTVGANRDQITFTPDGTERLIANEGEPNGYRPGDGDAEGSVSVIDLPSGTVRSADFWPSTARSTRCAPWGCASSAPTPPSRRIWSPSPSPSPPTARRPSSRSRRTTPSLCSTSSRPPSSPSCRSDSRTTCGRGYVLDASDRDGPSGTFAINIRPWPVFGMYQPDGIATFTFNGVEYLASANEGDARDWPGCNEEVRVGADSYVLDADVFPNASVLKQAVNLGRDGKVAAAPHAIRGVEPRGGLCSVAELDAADPALP